MTAYKHQFGPAEQRWLFAKNVGSQTIPAWGAVEIATTTITAKGYLQFSVKRPTKANLSSDLVALNGPTPIAVGKFGKVTLDFPALASYDDDDTLSIGQSLGTQLNSFELKRHARGFAVVGAAIGSTGSKRVPVVKNPGAQAFIGKLDAELSQGSSVTVSIWSGTANAETDSTINITAYDWLLATGQTMASGAKCAGLFINGIPYIIGGECA